MQPIRFIKLFNLTRGLLFLGILFFLVLFRTGSSNWNTWQPQHESSLEVAGIGQEDCLDAPEAGLSQSSSDLVENWQPLFSIGRYSTIQY